MFEFFEIGDVMAEFIKCFEFFDPIIEAVERVCQCRANSESLICPALPVLQGDETRYSAFLKFRQRLFVELF